MKEFVPKFALVSMTLVVLSGCLAMTPRAEPPPVMTAQEIAQQAAERALGDAIALYEKGHYQHAENKLLSDEVWQGSSETRQSALKHLAFIYCITDRAQMCRHAFERAMHINPYFVLSTAEATHPLWGPQYQLALKGKRD